MLQFPGWRVWRSDAGYFYATRDRALPLEAGRFKLFRMVHAPNAEGLCKELELQAVRQEQAEAVLGELS